MSSKAKHGWKLISLIRLSLRLVAVEDLDGNGWTTLVATEPIPSRDEVVLKWTTDWAATVDGVEEAGGADQPRVPLP